MPLLNRRAQFVVDQIVQRAHELRVQIHTLENGAQVIDCGIDVSGGLSAGRLLAETCMAGQGAASFAPAGGELGELPAVCVRTDQPIAACMGAQYAGWEVKVGDYFAMGSGPMRASGSREDILDELGLRETCDVAVGVLETSTMPTPEVAGVLAKACGVAPESLWLLVAPTNSQAGNVQVVARSVETALHKLHELDFDLHRIESGWGTAPLPPVAADALGGIGRTNDAILYGGQVVLWVRGDDESLQEIGPRTPSSASSDHGAPFAEVFKRYEYDFYKIDKLLFSPAAVTFVNLDTGHLFKYGQLEPQVLRDSFGW